MKKALINWREKKYLCHNTGSNSCPDSGEGGQLVYRPTNTHVHQYLLVFHVIKKTYCRRLDKCYRFKGNQVAKTKLNFKWKATTISTSLRMPGMSFPKCLMTSPTALVLSFGVSSDEWSVTWPPTTLKTSSNFLKWLIKLSHV